MGHKNERIKIYFDSDGVLANFKGYLDDHKIPYNPDNVRDKAVDLVMWNMIKEIPHFYYQLEPLDGAVELFQRLNEMYDCAVLTAIPKEKWGVPGTGEDKIDWCKKYLGEDVEVHIVYRDEKQNYAKDRYCILVDDLKRNIEEWEQNGGTGILYTDAASFPYAEIEKLAQMVN